MSQKIIHDWQGQGPYTKVIKNIEDDIQKAVKKVNDLTGIKESDTGLAPPALWDLAADKQTLQNEQPLQVSALLRITPVKGVIWCKFDEWRVFCFLICLFIYKHFTFFMGIDEESFIVRLK